MIFEEEDGVLCADGDMIAGSARIPLFLEDLNGLDFFGPWLEDIVFYLLIDLLLSVCGVVLKSVPEVVFLFDFLGPESGVDFQLVLVLQREYLGVGLDVEGRLRKDASAAYTEVADLVSHFGIALAAEGGQVDHSLSGLAEEVVETGSEQLHYFLHSALLDVEVLATL